MKKSIYRCWNHGEVHGPKNLLKAGFETYYIYGKN